MMQVYPVLDLLDGVVVRGVAGQRDAYRPIESPLTDQSDALSVARAFRDHFSLTTLYVADLDAIVRDRPNDGIIEELLGDGFRLILDAGVRSVDRLQQLRRLSPGVIVLALETISTPELLQRLAADGSPDDLAFSLDLKNGLPICDASAWGDAVSLNIARTAIEHHISHVIVLDLSQVGAESGPSTLQLCRDIIATAPTARVTTGGGVRDGADLRAIANCGASGALVSTALHRGTIASCDIECFAR